MIKFLKHIYFLISLSYQKLKFFLSINWIKTLYFNFKMFPFKIAMKLPVFFYGSIKFSSLKGKIIIDAPIKKGMIGFGQAYEMFSLSAKSSELILKGKLIFRGYAQFGKDCSIFIGDDAELDFGDMSSMGSKGNLICTKKITLKNSARVGSESQIIDTSFHQMINTNTGEKYEVSKPIIIGKNNYVGARVSIMKGTVTPDNCTIASNSLCNKDYSQLGSNILIGGIPAKLLKVNISRDWEGEKEMMDKHLKSRLF